MTDHPFVEPKVSALLDRRIDFANQRRRIGVKLNPNPTKRLPTVVQAGQSPRPNTRAVSEDKDCKDCGK